MDSITKFEHGLIRSLRDNLLDLNLDVDDSRRDVDAAVERLRVAVQRRDMVARDLQAVCEAAA